MKQKFNVSEISLQNVNHQDENGNTPLHHAVLNGSNDYLASTEPNFALIERLLALGANVRIKNHTGLHAGALMNEDNYKFVPALDHDTVIWKFQDRMGQYKKKYFEIVLNYQPTFENIQFFLESGFASASQIKIYELSQECLKSLISWCQNGIKIYNLNIKPSPVSATSFDKSNVPEYLRPINDIKALLKLCQEELNALEEYPYLPDVVAKIVNPLYRESMLVALTGSQGIKDCFDILVQQLNKIPLAKELKLEILKLNDEVKTRIKKNYPQFTCLNPQGETFVHSLFHELEVALGERQMHLDVQQITATNRWKHNGIKPTEQFKQMYESVLSQIVNFDHKTLHKPKILNNTENFIPNSSSSNTSSTSKL